MGSKWDGANRLVHFTNTSAGTASTFVYDGLSRLVRVVDTAHGAITADHTYLWCGRERCAAHDNTQTGSPISTRYFDQGTIISETASNPNSTIFSIPSSFRLRHHRRQQSRARHQIVHYYRLMGRMCSFAHCAHSIQR